MSKDISTVPGKTYVVTLSQAGVLSGVSEAGVPMVLASSDSAGQVSFQAISQVTTCTDDGATVLPFCDAPLPIGVDGGASALQVEGMVESALYDEVPTQHRTLEGTGNAALHWFQLDARRVPAGLLRGVSIPCRTSALSSVAQRALFLVLFEQTEDGSDWTVVGSSSEAVQQTIAETSRWEFDNLELSGRALRICAATERDVWTDDQWLGVRMAAGESGEESKGVGSSIANQVVDLTFEVVERVPKFVAQDVLDAHTTDSSVHISAEERTKWNTPALSDDEHEWLNNMRGGSQELMAPVLRVRGTLGNVMLTLRGNQSNVSVTGNAVSFNVGQYHVMSDTPVIYSYDEDSNSYHVYFAVAQDAVVLAPMGIAEPGVYAGNASLPLFLRGSELLWNGAVVDMHALTDLVMHKDALLELLNNGMASG